MSVQPQYLAYILEQLEAVGRLRTRRMFGAVGLYSGELFFGIIDDDTVFFKADASNSADYIARNMPRFMPSPDRPDAVKGYFQVPADIIEDAEPLVVWARKSVEVALTSHAAKHRPKARARKPAPVAKRPAKAGNKTVAKKSPARRAKPAGRRGKIRRATARPARGR